MLLLFATFFSRLIRLISPNLNYFIIAGTMMVFISIFLRTFPFDANDDEETYKKIRITFCYVRLIMVMFVTMSLFRFLCIWTLLDTLLLLVLFSLRCGGYTTSFIILHQIKRYVICIDGKFIIENAICSTNFQKNACNV